MYMKRGVVGILACPDRSSHTTLLAISQVGDSEFSGVENYKFLTLTTPPQNAKCPWLRRGDFQGFSNAEKNGPTRFRLCGDP
jgi:hypothetical protein